MKINKLILISFVILSIVSAYSSDIVVLDPYTVTGERVRIPLFQVSGSPGGSSYTFSYSGTGSFSSTYGGGASSVGSRGSESRPCLGIVKVGSTTSGDKGMVYNLLPPAGADGLLVQVITADVVYSDYSTETLVLTEVAQVVGGYVGATDTPQDSNTIALPLSTSHGAVLVATVSITAGFNPNVFSIPSTYAQHTGLPANLLSVGTYKFDTGSVLYSKSGADLGLLNGCYNLVNRGFSVSSDSGAPAPFFDYMNSGGCP